MVAFYKMAATNKHPINISDFGLMSGLYKHRPQMAINAFLFVFNGKFYVDYNKKSLTL